MATVRVEIGQQVLARKAARAELDVEQVALDGRAHREARRRLDRDLAQPVTQHDLAEIRELAQTRGEEGVETLVVVLVESGTALEEIEIAADGVHDAELGHLVARRHGGIHTRELGIGRAELEEVARPVPVMHGDVAGHKAVIRPDPHVERGLGRDCVETGGRGEVGMVAKDGQGHAAELGHLGLGDMDRRAAGQQARDERCRLAGEHGGRAAGAMGVDQVGHIVRDKAVHLGRQAQIEALARRRDDLGGQQRHALRGTVVAGPVALPGIAGSRVLDLDLPGVRAGHVARPRRLEGNAMTTVDIEHTHDIPLPQRQLALGDKARPGEIARRRPRRRDVMEISEHVGGQFEHGARRLVERLGRVHERELLAIGERPVALPRVDHAIDVPDHVRDGAAADAELEAPREARREERAVVRDERGLERRGNDIRAFRHQVAAVRLDLLATPAGQVVERGEQVGARGHGRRKREVGVHDRREPRRHREGLQGGPEPVEVGRADVGGTVRGIFVHGGLRRCLSGDGARAHGGAQPLDALDAALVEISKRRRDRVLAHAIVASGRGAAAAVVDDLDVLEVERDVGIVDVAVRAAHRSRDGHGVREPRVARIEPHDGAVEHERAPAHERAVERRLAPQRRDKRPPRHMHAPYQEFLPASLLRIRPFQVPEIA